MKRIIFSLYTDNVDQHQSATSYKRNQFLEYKDLLLARQKEYALACGADYELFTTKETDYNIIQFDKILKIEELCKYYDEVLYLDFDVIPRTLTNFFDRFDLNNLCIYPLSTKLPDRDIFHWRITEWEFEWDPMEMFVKCCAKNAMLLLEGVTGSQECVNTGVFGANKYSIEKLAFSENIQPCKDLLQQAKNDNIYPGLISDAWIPNNEVFVSYLLERYNIPFTNIGMGWNFILDHITREPSIACHFIHCVNKDFSVIL